MFYPGDWLRDQVSGCSLAAQGLWLRMMILAHDSDRYGYLSMNGKAIPEESIALRCGCSLPTYLTLLTELDDARVPSRTPEGIIFSRRMVRDAKTRTLTKIRVRKYRKRNADVTHDVTHMYEYENEKESAFEVDVGSKSNSKAKPDSIQEIAAYCETRAKHINPEAFWDFYQSKGWKVGNQPMKDWRAAVRNWERRLGGANGRSLNKAEQRTRDNLRALDAAFPLARRTTDNSR